MKSEILRPSLQKKVLVELATNDGKDGKFPTLYDFAFRNSLKLPYAGFAISLRLHQHPKLFVVVDQLDGVVI